MASTLPSRKPNRSPTKPLMVLNRKTPNAKVPANRTPIAVSWRRPDRLDTYPIASAVPTAATAAPM